MTGVAPVITGLGRYMRVRPKIQSRSDVSQRSSMENFLDDYQVVRLFMALFGLALIGVVGETATVPDMVPYLVGLGLTGGHAVWCRLRHIRSPRTMLLLDLTLWGAVVALSDEAVIDTAIFAFLLVLAVLFADRYWMIGLVGYVTMWYGISHFRGELLTVDLIGRFLSVLLITGGLAAVMYRIRQWLGRLDANRSQMLGTVSHELRNTLTGIMGLTDIVSNSTDLDPEEARELIGLANRQAIDATEIVEDMLTATSLERSALTVDIEAVDVNHEVSTTVRRFVGTGTEVSFEAGDSVPTAMGDALRVRQILRNLVSNAVRYGGDSIVISTRSEADIVEIIVADDGLGVPAEDESTIFLPYKRSTNTRRDADSVGLGLWICRQLAHAMGGQLDYRRAGQATEFILTLGIHRDDPMPVKDAVRESKHPKELSAHGQGQTLSAVSL